MAWNHASKKPRMQRDRTGSAAQPIASRQNDAEARGWLKGLCKPEPKNPSRFKPSPLLRLHHGISASPPLPSSGASETNSLSQQPRCMVSFPGTLTTSATEVMTGRHDFSFAEIVGERHPSRTCLGERGGVCQQARPDQPPKCSRSSAAPNHTPGGCQS